MRLLVKLAILALIVHGMWRVGSSFWRFYQLEDALQEVAQFGERSTEAQLCGQALDKATALDVPLTAEAVTIRRGQNPAFNCQAGYQAAVNAATQGPTAKIFIDARYSEGLQVLPGYRYPWEFSTSVSAWVRP